MQIEKLQVDSAPVPTVHAHLRQESAILFQLDAQLQLLTNESDDIRYTADLSAELPVAWTPRGEYSLQCALRDLRLPAGSYRLRLIVFAEVARERVALADHTVPFECSTDLQSADAAGPEWSLMALPGMPNVDELPWNQGLENWFFRHFDHAALVITDYLLQGHSLLKGRILDVGCGDGIIDLGIFHRNQPEELVGIDPFRGYERLPAALAEVGLPTELLDDPRLKFLPEDANAIPYPDDSFDVVVSWGSLEHIAGGYGKALSEIRRVLKRDALLFVHPGLYFGALGNHLGEFFDDPFIHLKLPPEELREKVLSTEPRRMDRSGHVATPEEYWQWFTELNPIRVAEFERELRELGFEPWRVALRSSDLVEYTPELQGHSMVDLATSELYMSAWNRKN